MFRLQGLKLSFRKINSKCSADFLRKLSAQTPKHGETLDSLKQSDYSPSTYDKYILVWAKKYPSVKDVPNVIPLKTMEKARTVSQIHINIALCVLTGTVCFSMIIAGKYASKKGESITKMNLNWHEVQNQNEK